jgi:hypothetical protein
MSTGLTPPGLEAANVCSESAGKTAFDGIGDAPDSDDEGLDDDVIPARPLAAKARRTVQRTVSRHSEPENEEYLDLALRPKQPPARRALLSVSHIRRSQAASDEDSAFVYCYLTANTEERTTSRSRADIFPDIENDFTDTYKVCLRYATDCAH